MNLDSLLALAADLGLAVRWANLGQVRRGEYQDDARLIILDKSLTRAQAISTLAHEIGHAARRDRCHGDPAVERRAWRYGAALCIPVEEYRRAEGIVGSHPSAIAVELGVTRRLVEAWQEWWEECPRQDSNLRPVD